MNNKQRTQDIDRFKDNEMIIEFKKDSYHKDAPITMSVTRKCDDGLTRIYGEEITLKSAIKMKNKLDSLINEIAEE